MVKIYKQPFARDGDTIEIPEASQPDGKMSSADGWTPDYQLPKTDPNYKPVGRQEMNGVFKEVTEALGQVQVQGAASWSVDGAPYPINAQVYHSGKQWIALRENSVEPVGGANWSAVGTAATRDVGTSPGSVMQVGAFGLGSFAQVVPEPFRIQKCGFFEVGVDTYVVLARSASRACYLKADNGGGSRVTLTAQTFNPEDGVAASDAFVIHHTGNLLQATGTSTTFPMSQKAVTDALGVFGQPSMTGSATLNGTTGNTVQLTSIVTTLGLEVGDVIRIQYSGYDKLHTVESITNNNLIVVNYEHAGNRGDGSLKLADETATVTIKRIAKWYNAPTGLGQAWVNFTVSRNQGVDYTNTTGRTISVTITVRDATVGRNISMSVTVSGAVIAYATISSETDTPTLPVFFVVPAGESYRVDTISVGDYIYNWVELR